MKVKKGKQRKDPIRVHFGITSISPGCRLEGGDAPLQGVQGLGLLGADQALYLQGQGVDIGADLECGRLVALNMGQSGDRLYAKLTNQRPENSPGQG